MKIEAFPQIDTGKRQETGYLFMPKAWRRGRLHGPRLLAMGLVGGCLTLGLLIVSGAL